MRLKLRHPGGQKTLKIDDDTSISVFLEEIQSSTGIVPEYQIIKTGFPPSAIDVITSGKISDFFKNGDSIIIENSPTKIERNSTSDVKPVAEKETSSQNRKPAADISSPLANSNLEIYKIPDDNSCMFRCMGYLCDYDGSDDKVSELRQLVCGLIISDTNKWNTAILGAKPEEYIQQILKPNTWGGSVELSVLSEYYNVCIIAIEVKNLQVYKFGEENNYSESIFCLYDGIHYDALHCGEFRRFSSTDPYALARALEVAKTAKQSGKYTDVYTFKLKCLVCGSILTGQDGAQAHAESTGHQRFDQV